MSAGSPEARSGGMAFRVTLMGHPQTEAYSRVRVELDRELRLVHLFSEDGAVHYLTAALETVLIEWTDPTPLEPQPRIPPFGHGALERMGEQMQRLAEGMTRSRTPAPPAPP